MKTTAEILMHGLAAQETSALLIGGFALQAHGVVRHTIDFDCLLADVDSKTLDQVLRDAGFEQCQRTGNFARYSHPSVYLMDIDALFVDEDTFGRLLEESSPMDLAGATVRVPAIHHLVMLKLHAIRNDSRRRMRDISDIVELLRANPEAISDEELERFASEYGPPGIYGAILSSLG